MKKPFSETLKSAIASAGLTQTKVAKLAGMSRRSIIYYLTGEQTPVQAIQTGLLALIEAEKSKA